MKFHNHLGKKILKSSRKGKIQQVHTRIGNKNGINVVNGKAGSLKMVDQCLHNPERESISAWIYTRPNTNQVKAEQRHFQNTIRGIFYQNQIKRKGFRGSHISGYRADPEFWTEGKK